jgi:cysteine desulfurase family protein
MSASRLYLDNAATSFPKPPEVLEAMTRFMREFGVSPGRGAYRETVEAGRIVRHCRQRLNALIHGASSDHIIFALNCTDALNLAIKGVVAHSRARGERVHVITTMMDHNSILRPLNALIERDSAISQTRIACDPKTTIVDHDDLRSAISTDTKLVAIAHGSNVTGALQPIAELGAICRERGIVFLVDAAQTLGHVPIDVEAACIDLLAFPGHKGLLGPLGTGGLYIRPGVESRIDSMREGGTGTMSEHDVQPESMPDKYEPGSSNAVGIVGLEAGVRWITERGVESLWQHEQRLVAPMLEGLRNVPGLRLLGPDQASQRCGVFSFVIDGFEPMEIAAVLEDRYGILGRAGLHCAPRAHELLGTMAHGGAMRLSVGPFNTESDVMRTTEAVGELCRELASMAN